MPEYLLTAKSPLGATVTERIDAISADKAVLTMHERGYSEITLHTDDVGALYAKPSEVPEFTAAEHLEFRN